MILALLMLAAVPLDCDDPITQIDMTMCAQAAFERADAELNKAWKPAYAEMQRLDREYQTAGEGLLGYAPALLASQRAWIAYRDAQCEVESQENRGGSGQPMVYSLCKERLTQERTMFLRGLLKRDF